MLLKVKIKKEPGEFGRVQNAIADMLGIMVASMNQREPNEGVDYQFTGTEYLAPAEAKLLKGLIAWHCSEDCYQLSHKSGKQVRSPIHSLMKSLDYFKPDDQHYCNEHMKKVAEQHKSQILTYLKANGYI